MTQCYSWKNNLLSFIDQNDNTFHFEFKGNKTIVCGESGTGKTLICSALKYYIEDINNQDYKVYDANNIFLLSRDNKNKLKDQKGKLIIIDRAEMVLDHTSVEFINADRGINRYLIFLRKPIGIELSPNYFAVLDRKDNSFQLKYPFDIKGWA